MKSDVRAQAKDELADWFSEQIDKVMMETLMKQPVFGVREGGFCFVYANWGLAIRKDLEYHRADAIAHYDEAIRRQAVCRLDGYNEEAAWYTDFVDYLKMNFKLEEIHGSST